MKSPLPLFVLTFVAGCTAQSNVFDPSAVRDDEAATSFDPANATPIDTDENFDCVGHVTGSFANVFVPPGETCILQDAVVNGNVLAEDDAQLFVLDTNVEGNIDGVEASVVHVGGTVLGGSIQIQDGTSPGETGVMVFGGTRLTQGNITIQKMNTGTIRIEDVVLVKGNIQAQENTVGTALEITGNEIAQNLQVFVNGGPGTKEVQGNTVGQSLQCKENTAPFTGGPNDAGEAEDQCF